MTPSQSSIAAAGAQATGLSASNFNIVNGPGAGTYPLANFSWTLIYQKQSNATLGVVLGKLLDWVTTTGQQQAAALGYSPLPANVVALAHQTLLELENSAGKPLFSTDALGPYERARGRRPDDLTLLEEVPPPRLTPVRGVKDALQRRWARPGGRAYAVVRWAGATLFAAIVVGAGGQPAGVVEPGLRATRGSASSGRGPTTPAKDIYPTGIFIVGTLITTAVAIVLAVPIGVGTAAFLSELAPRWLAAPLSVAIDLIAAVPSIVVGLWGLLVLTPVFAHHVEPFLKKIPVLEWFFHGPAVGPSMLLAGMVLAVMILPTIVALSRTAMSAWRRGRPRGGAGPGCHPLAGGAHRGGARRPHRASRRP